MLPELDDAAAVRDGFGVSAVFQFDRSTYGTNELTTFGVLIMSRI